MSWQTTTGERPVASAVWRRRDFYVCPAYHVVTSGDGFRIEYDPGGLTEGGKSKVRREEENEYRTVASAKQTVIALFTNQGARPDEILWDDNP